MAKRKYIKRNCEYWGHVFISLGISNRLESGDRVRFCSRCQKHFIHSGGGVLPEELVDLIETTLADLPKQKIVDVVRDNRDYEFCRIYQRN